MATTARPVHRKNVFASIPSLGALLLSTGCLFQGGDPADPVPDEKPYPGPCYVLSDDGADGSFDWKTVYAYDDHGSPVKETQFSLPEDGDGGRSDSRSYVYDANGYILSKTEDTYDDGRADSKQTFIRDGEGRVLRRETENYSGSSVRTLTLYTYDDSGNKLSEKYDYGMDGSFENIDLLTYDAKGDTLTHAIGDDRDGDGVMRVDRTVAFTYDAKGNRLTLHATGLSTETRYNYVYTFDPQGYPSTQEMRLTGGELIRLTRYQYDAGGRKLAEESDDLGDGTVEWKSAWDAKGNRLLEARDNDGDGVYETVYQSTYDSAGNRLTASAKTDLVSIPEERRVFYYDCWETGGSVP